MIVGGNFTQMMNLSVFFFQTIHMLRQDTTSRILLHLSIFLLNNHQSKYQVQVVVPACIVASSNNLLLKRRCCTRNWTRRRWKFFVSALASWFGSAFAITFASALASALTSAFASAVASALASALAMCCIIGCRRSSG